MTVQPRCPYCNAQGIHNITAKRLGEYALIFCGQCGAIHGVAPITTRKQQETAVTAQDETTQQETAVSAQDNAELSPDQAAAVMTATKNYGSRFTIGLPKEED